MLFVYERTVGVRYKDHTDGKCPSSAVCEHMLETGHRFPFDQTKILCQEDNTFKSRIHEAFFTSTATARPSAANGATRSPLPSLVSCHMTSPVMWRHWHNHVSEQDPYEAVETSDDVSVSVSERWEYSSSKSKFYHDSVFVCHCIYHCVYILTFISVSHRSFPSQSWFFIVGKW